MIARLTSIILTFAALALGATSTASAQDQAFDYGRLRDEGAKLLSEYLRINTTNPPGNELATARWLKEVLKREGIEGQILDTAEMGPGRANFYARLENGKLRWVGVGVGEKRTW